MTVEIKELLEAGVHFGHQTRRWNPKMKPFIFTSRNGIYVIDLKKTLECLKVACLKAKEAVARGGVVLFVGTKKQAQEVIEQEAKRCGMFYVTQRWLGGTLTNFATIRRNIRRLRDIERMAQDGTFEKLTKKEVLGLERERGKLELVLGGIKDMGELPGLLYVVDSKKERIAVAEANKLGIPVIAVVDTNSDPDVIDFPVAGNDDAIKSIKIITQEIATAILEARHILQESQQNQAETKAS
ncbi:MAG: 30S ribosomal protein S2 [candidate division Zixibacteria bacterium RBG_16_50_21]|nr:MAG: 30S ribosomal protein S2 [candidate division Zixibacteria bacterium RBG_16_50_21]